MDNKPKTNKDDDVITLNIQPLLTPISILLGVVILSASLLIGLHDVANSLDNGGGVATTTTGTGTTTTDTGTGTTAQPTVDIDSIKSLYDGDYIKFGDGDRDVLFVEVADPSCPYCHIAAGKNPDLNKSAGTQFTLVADGGTYVAPVPEMRKLVEDGKASYLYLYTNGHGNGEMGAKAMFCAFEKGKYWEAHDLLYSAAGYSLLNDNVKNDKSKAGVMADFLKDAVDSDFMEDCLSSGKYDSRIASDSQAATGLGVQGTPGYFVNETNFPGAYNYTDMESAVNAAL